MYMSAGLPWTRDLENERRPQTLYGMVSMEERNQLREISPCIF